MLWQFYKVRKDYVSYQQSLELLSSKETTLYIFLLFINRKSFHVLPGYCQNKLLIIIKISYFAIVPADLCDLDTLRRDYVKADCVLFIFETVEYLVENVFE